MLYHQFNSYVTRHRENIESEYERDPEIPTNLEAVYLMKPPKWSIIFVWNGLFLDVTTKCPAIDEETSKWPILGNPKENGPFWDFFSNFRSPNNHQYQNGPFEKRENKMVHSGVCIT